MSRIMLKDKQIEGPRVVPMDFTVGIKYTNNTNIWAPTSVNITYIGLFGSLGLKGPK